MVQRASLTELVKRTFVEMMKDVGTSIPGHIISFNPATQLAQIQIGIRRIDNNGNTFVPPPLIECPVYVYGGDYAVEVQIDPGCEGVIIFSQRCIDAWVNTGGVANNPILRFHDFSDAYFLPGMRSQPNALPSFENNGIRMRNRSGDQSVWLKDDGTVHINSTGLFHNGVNIGETHTHPQGDDSAGNTQQDTDGPQ